MNAFWAIGIGINAIVLVAVVYWFVKNWKQSDPGQQEKKSSSKP
jgi:hypothetical protein